MLKAKIQIISLYNAPHLCYILHDESSSGLTVLSLSKTLTNQVKVIIKKLLRETSLSDHVVLKKLESRDKLGNDQVSKWKIIKDEKNEGWMFVQKPKNGQYLRAGTDKTKLETDGIWLR